MKRFMSIMSLLMLVCLMAGCGSYDLKNAVVEDADVVVWVDMEESVDSKDGKKILDTLVSFLEKEQLEEVNKAFAAFGLKAENLPSSLSKMVVSASSNGQSIEEMDPKKLDVVVGLQFRKELEFKKLEDAIRAFATAAGNQEGKHYALKSVELDDAECCLLSEPNNDNSLVIAVASIDKEIILMGTEDAVKKAVERVAGNDEPEKTEEWMLDVDKQSYVAVRMPAQMKKTVAAMVAEMPFLAGLDNAKGAVLGLDLDSDCKLALTANMASDKDAEALKKNVWDGMVKPIVIKIQQMPAKELGFDPKVLDGITCEVKGDSVNVNFSFKASDVVSALESQKKMMQEREAKWEEMKRMEAEAAAMEAKNKARMAKYKNLE